MTEKGRWAGSVYGTNTGKCFLTLDEGAEGFEGVLRFRDDDFGQIVFNVVAREHSDRLQIQGSPADPSQAERLGLLTIDVSPTPDGDFDGDWHTASGLGGRILLHPHGRKRTDSKEISEPVQMHTARTELGAIEVFKDDIERIAESVKRGFAAGFVTVTVNTGTEQTYMLDHFIDQEFSHKNASLLKIFAQERDENGYNRSQLVEFGQAYNIIVVQGVDREKVLGAREMLRSEISQYEHRGVGFFRKHGITIRNAILIWSIIYVSYFDSLEQRALFFGAMIAIIAASNQLERKFLPLSMITLRRAGDSSFSGLRRNLISLLIAISATVAAGFISSHFEQLLSLIGNAQ